MLVGIFGMLVGCWLMVCWVMQLVSQVSEALACKQALKQPRKQALKQPRTQRHCSADKRGGGVLIALREDIAYNRINSRNNSPNWSDRIEIIALELNLLNSKKTLVCACYRPPSCDLEEWFELFTAFLP